MIKILDNHPVRPEDKDEFYHDILDGLSVFLDSSLILDVLHTIREYPLLRLGHSFNLAQVTSKKWLLDELAESCGKEYGTVYILGGWYGVLGAMFLHDPRFSIENVVSVDIDPQCQSIAAALNRTHVQSSKFQAVTADIYDLDYGDMVRSDAQRPKPDLVVNTSCEHLPDFERWYDMIPPHTLVAVQSNDYFDDHEHINCVADLHTFSQQVALAEERYRGQIKLKKYTRFMLIGVK